MTRSPSTPANSPAPRAALSVPAGSARVTYDRVGGGWHPDQQWTDRVSFCPRCGETDEQAALRVFRTDYHPQARVLRVEISPNT